MKQIVLMAVLALWGAAVFAQPTRQTIQASAVPKSVQDALEQGIGFPAEGWELVTINPKQKRYVATVTRMDNASGQMLKHRYRYTEDGRMTSESQYRGNGNGNTEELLVYLGTGGVEETVQNALRKRLDKNTLVSFEGFSFAPGNQENWVKVHRIVSNTGATKSIVYLDNNGNEVNMSKYPVRLLESQDAD